MRGQCLGDPSYSVLCNSSRKQLQRNLRVLCEISAAAYLGLWSLSTGTAEIHLLSCTELGPAGQANQGLIFGKAPDVDVS